MKCIAENLFSYKDVHVVDTRYDNSCIMTQYHDEPHVQGVGAGQQLIYDGNKVLACCCGFAPFMSLQQKIPGC